MKKELFPRFPLKTTMAKEHRVFSQKKKTRCKKRLKERKERKKIRRKEKKI